MSLAAIVAVLLAGLSTVLGCCFLKWARHKQDSILALGLGFSAGAMIFISLTEIWQRSLIGGSKAQTFYAFILGIGIIGIIDLLIPKSANPHEAPDDHLTRQQALKSTGLMAAIAIALHNLPEGFVSVMAVSEGFSFSWPLIIAIAIHNIPEGIAIALPIYAATGSVRKAILWTTLAGLAEPLGGFLAYAFFSGNVATLQPTLYAVTAGIMVYISFDELLPMAISINKHHLTLSGIIMGMTTMGLSVILFS